MAECCNRNCITKFCPHCGMPMVEHNVSGLLAFCKTHLAKAERELASAEKHPEHGSFNERKKSARDKWKLWTNGLQELIENSERVENVQ